MLVLSGSAVVIHAVTFLLPKDYWSLCFFARNQLLAVVLLFCCALLLDFLSFHYLFGPWAIIIGELMLPILHHFTSSSFIGFFAIFQEILWWTLDVS